jgi:accessory gene regulator B
MLLFEKISNDIASKITGTMKSDTVNKEVIAYGAYILLDTILAIGMVMILGALCGVLFQALVVSFASALLRKTSGGAHATTSLRCAIIGAVFSVGFALIIGSLKDFITIPISISYLVITFVISYYINIKLAPKDSPNKPIVKENKIKELKFKSIRTLCIYLVICLCILIFYYYSKVPTSLSYIALICTGYLWQSFTLTSLGHSLTYVLEAPFRYIIFLRR